MSAVHKVLENEDLRKIINEFVTNKHLHIKFTSTCSGYIQVGQVYVRKDCEFPRKLIDEAELRLKQTGHRDQYWPLTSDIPHYIDWHPLPRTYTQEGWNYVGIQAIGSVYPTNLKHKMTQIGDIIRSFLEENRYHVEINPPRPHHIPNELVNLRIIAWHSRLDECSKLFHPN